jgi:hypothetical protein
LRGHHDRDARFEGDLEKLGGAWIVQRNVHAVRLGGVRLDLAQGGAKVLRTHRPAREHAHAARVRNRDHQRGIRRRPAHRRLEDRMLDAQELGDPGFQVFSCWMKARA